MILNLELMKGRNLLLEFHDLLVHFGDIKSKKTAKMTVEISNEHKLISNRYNFLDKYQLIGKLKDFTFDLEEHFGILSAVI